MPDSSKKQSKQKDKRVAEMEAGVLELERWLTDLMEQGLATVEKLPSKQWDDFAASMHNAKMRGIGNRIKLIKQLFSSDNWPDRMLAELAELYLFTQAFQRLDMLNTLQQQDLLTLAGVNVKKEEVLKGQGVKDHWLVIGQQFRSEEKLQVRRTWLLGEKKQDYALILDFSWGNQGFPENWVVGSAIQAEIVYYPASFPQRALIKQFEMSADPFDGFIGYADFATFAQAYADAVVANPWLYQFPCLLDQVTPVYDQGHFILVDAKRKQIPLSIQDQDGWKTLAISAGRPLKIFGEWDGQTCFLLSAVYDQRLVNLLPR